MKLIILISILLKMTISYAGKMPVYALHPSAKEEYRRALELLNQYGNSDEFYRFVLNKRRYFRHSPYNVAESLKLFRQQLNRGGVISIEFDKFEQKDILGIWNGDEIRESLSHKMTNSERAGHILHETSHRFGWKHKGNSSTENDNINSFPYAIGLDFVEFLDIQLANTATLKIKPPRNIRETLISNLSKFRYCYQKEIKDSDSTVEGRAILKFTVGKNGKVVSGSILGSPSITRSMKLCMSDTLNSIIFPKSKSEVYHSQLMSFSAKE